MSRTTIAGIIFLVLSVWSLHAATISGVISDSDTEAPVEGATVLLISGGGFGGEPLDTVATATTDAAGAYSFADLAAGRYEITASMTGYGEAERGARVRNEADEIERNLQLNPDGAPAGEGTISGTITNAEDESPIEGAVVVLSEGGAEVATATTDAAGAYSFTGLGDARYAIDVTADGFDPGRDGRVEIEEGAEETADIALEVYVAPNGIISGTITLASTEEPVGANVSVELLQRFGGGGVFTFELVAGAVTDAGGMYEFTGLESSGGGGGNFRMYAIAVGGDTTNWVEVNQDETTTVDIEVEPEDAVGTLTAGGASALSIIRSDNALIFRGLETIAKINIYSFNGSLLQSGEVNSEYNMLRLKPNLANEPLILQMKSGNNSRREIIR